MTDSPTEGHFAVVDTTGCGLYKPGHQVHWIQARLARETPPASCRNGTVLFVDDEGWIAVEVDGVVTRFWNHDPERARFSFAMSERHVGLPEHGLLHAPDGSGNTYSVCVTTEGPTPCKPPSL